MKTSYYNVEVRAGFPSAAMDYLEERIDLNKVLIEHPLSTFIIECTGDHQPMKTANDDILVFVIFQQMLPLQNSSGKKLRMVCHSLHD